jgi:hypothetical protein
MRALLVFVLVLFAAGLGLRYYFTRQPIQPITPKAAPPITFSDAAGRDELRDRLEREQQRLATLQESLDQLNAVPAAAPGSPNDAEDIKVRIRQLQVQLGELAQERFQAAAAAQSYQLSLQGQRADSNLNFEQQIQTQAPAVAGDQEVLQETEEMRSERLDLEKQMQDLRAQRPPDSEIKPLRIQELQSQIANQQALVNDLKNQFASRSTTANRH